MGWGDDGHGSLLLQPEVPEGPEEHGSKLVMLHVTNPVIAM